MHFSKPPLGTPLDWENPLNKGGVLALAMNEGHGDKVQDLSLNDNNGTLHNFAFPPTVASGWNPGQTGRGLNFDGTSDYVGCGDIGAFPAKGTISVLVNGAKENYRNIFSTQLSINVGIRSSVYTAGTWRLYFGGNNHVVPDFVEDVWHNFVVVWDTTRSKISAYLDGNVVIDDANEIDFPPTIPDFRFGVGYSTDANRHWKGHIDQPRIMKRVWSAKEVRDYAMNPWQVYLDDDD